VTNSVDIGAFSVALRGVVKQFIGGTPKKHPEKQALTLDRAEWY
jgi:hypothetical protein